MFLRKKSPCSHHFPQHFVVKKITVAQATLNSWRSEAMRPVALTWGYGAIPHLHPLDHIYIFYIYIYVCVCINIFWYVYSGIYI